VRNYVPAGWEVAKLGELGLYHNGRAFKKSEWRTEGRPIIRIQNLTGSGKTWNHFQGDVDPRNEANPGDLLVSWAATLGAYIWDGPQAVVNQHIFKVETHIDKRFHFYAIRRAIDELYRNAHGIGMVHVTRKVFDETEVPLPPEREQHRIVEAIESYLTRLDDAVASLERVQRNLERYRASVLKAAVEGRLVPTEAELARQEGGEYEPASKLLERILAERKARWIEDAAEKARAKAEAKALKAGKPWTPEDSAKALDKAHKAAEAKYKEPAPPDTTDLPALPEGWCWATVEQLVDVGTGATPKKGEPRYWEGGSIAWVGSAVVNRQYVAEATAMVTEAALRETNLTVYPPGTLLVAMYGEGKTRGKCAELLIESTTNQALAALVSDGYGDGLRRFIKLFMEHNYTAIRRTASGGVQPNLNLGIVRSISIPLPPLAEQVRLCDETERLLSVRSELDEAMVVNRQRGMRLRQSILKWAFEGKLVEQDPNDEPASALLDRILSDREGMER